MADSETSLIARFFDGSCPDPLAFFERASEQTSCSFFWKGRDDKATWMGFGCVDSLNSFAECRAALKRIALDDVPFAARGFCAVPFDRDFRPVAPWESFPSRLFIVPQILIRQTNGSASVLILRPRDDSRKESEQRQRLTAEIEAVRGALLKSPPVVPHPASVRTVLQTQRGEWRRMLGEVMPELKRGALRKVVLARSASAFTDEPIRAGAVLAGLLAQEGCSIFALRSGNGVFLGASPERLFALDGDKLTTESLAGTRPRGRTDREDRKLADALLESEKERREHDIVREFIASRLNALCAAHETDQPAVRQLTTVQHLSTTLRGTLRHGAGPDQVLEALHPTPAVCGDPRDAAGELIRRLEATPRGYYAGAIGWADAGQAEMAVAIRCGLIKGKRAIVFAGAGIVAGSDPDAEWDETENKMRPYLQALGGTDS
jgi:isochorismate synthase